MPRKSLLGRREYMRDYMKKRRKIDPDFKSSLNKHIRNFQKRQRSKLFNLLGGFRCSTCSFSDIRALQIDHKNGGGNKETRKRGNSWISYYVKHPKEAKSKLQILCANCNWIKRYENNEIKVY